jgi:cell division protein FtsX
MIGRKFQFVAFPQGWIQVIGVAKDGKYVRVSDPPEPYFYLTSTQVYASDQVLRVRASLPPERVIPEVREAIAEIAPGLPVSGVETMVEQLESGPFGAFRLGAWCAGTLGILGLTLAVVGLYGVVSFTASQRTREIGIRMALGAQASNIRRLVLGQGLIVVFGGLLLGTIVSLAATPITRRFLLGVKAADPLTFVGVAIVLILIAFAACYLPVRRAIRVNPMIALRHQ